MHEPERTSWGLQGYKPNVKHQKYKKGFKFFSSFINAEYNISLTVKSEEKKNLKGTYSLSLCLFRTCPEPINSKMALEIKYGWGGTLCPRAWEVWPLGWVGAYYTNTPRHWAPPDCPTHSHPHPKDQVTLQPLKLCLWSNLPPLLRTHWMKHRPASLYRLFFSPVVLQLHGIKTLYTVSLVPTECPCFFSLCLKTFRHIKKLCWQ